MIIIYCTALIAGRLCLGPHVEARSFRRIASVLVESAAIVAIWTLFYAITREMGCQLLQIGETLMPQFVGLSNMLIYLRVGLGWSQSDASSPSNAASSGIVMTNPASIVGVSLNHTRSVGAYDLEVASGPVSDIGSQRGELK
ncbi:hypothetical protein C8F01DRAFT_43189 [Mycena amicta]|nr:hypothetical protein C8F01DRAFT_43189 [Mycena amicta]